MKILITEDGEIINQDHIKRIEVEDFDKSITITFYLSSDKYSWDNFQKSEEINDVFAEEILKEILINECTKDVIDMRKVKKLYKHRERLEVEKYQ